MLEEVKDHKIDNTDMNTSNQRANPWIADIQSVSYPSLILHLFTKRSRSVPSRLAHPSFLLLSKKPTDGRLDAFLLTGLVERILAAVGAAAICGETGRDKGNHKGGNSRTRIKNRI